ncbi:MAG: hypothetical protein BroJett026_37090 [Betaproteobacteria bacterium]|nr:MAG: hypothetical protein BroJett026_37090 [Betaproteobacteria bacterium]
MANNARSPRLRKVLVGVAAAALAAAGAVAIAQQKTFYSWGSSATGTSQYVFVGTVIGMARQHLPGVSFANEAVSGTTQNLDLLSRGEIALAIASPERLHAAVHGQGPYKDKPLPARVMWVMNEQAALLFTKADSGIAGFKDLKGKRVAIGPAGSSNELKNAFLLEAYGYKRKAGSKSDFEDLTTVRLSHPEAANALAEGQIHAAIATQPIPDPSFAELAVKVPLRVAGVDADMFGKVTGVYRWLWPVTVPAGSFKGQDRQIVTLGDPNLIIAHRDNLPEKVAYDLTKAYVEKILPEMAKQTDYLKPYASDRQALAGAWPVPGHPGAIRYFREIGLKIPEPTN